MNSFRVIVSAGGCICTAWAVGCVRGGPAPPHGGVAKAPNRLITARVVPGPEVLVSHGEEGFAHVETMLTANPADPGHLLVSCITIAPKHPKGRFSFRTRSYVSRDAGQTWKAGPLMEEGTWDPVVAFTPRGTALLVCLRARLAVFRSEDGAVSWRNPVQLSSMDHPMLAVDWTSGARRGRIYIAGREGSEATDPVVVFRSLDDGGSFERTVALEKPQTAGVEHMLVLRDGTLLLLVRTEGSNAEEIISCLRSKDGGQTFSSPVTVATRRFAGDRPPGNHPNFASGLRGAAERVYTVYASPRGGGNARLVLTLSDDGGQTWSPPREIAQDVPGEVTHAAANIMVNPAGTIGISWLQRTIRPTPQENYRVGDRIAWNFNEQYDLLFAASLDGGESFLPPVRITRQSSNPRSRHASRFFPGEDYMLAAAAGDGTFHLLWPDARTGVFQLYTCAVRVE
jgi:hypothetical protein